MRPPSPDPTRLREQMADRCLPHQIHTLTAAASYSLDLKSHRRLDQWRGHSRTLRLALWNTKWRREDWEGRASGAGQVASAAARARGLRGLGFRLLLYTSGSDPMALIHLGFIQQLKYIGPPSGGPKIVDWAELHSSFFNLF